MDLTFAAITAAISTFSPYLIDLIKYFAIDKIKDEHVRSSALFIVTNLVGFCIAAIVDTAGGYGAGLFNCFLIGSGIGQTVGEGTYRTRKWFRDKGTEVKP